MQVNADNLISITDANQNFSRVAKIVDTKGAAVILKNNMPRYVLLEYGQFEKEEFADTATVQEIGERLIKKHLPAFEALAK